MKLNLGCGQNKKDGYVNVDKFDSFAPDVVWDLEQFPWPFEDDSVEEIVMYHSLEHMGGDTDTFLSIMKELYRVCMPDGVVHITVPHQHSDGFDGDPTHVRPINGDILSLFSKAKNREWKELGWPNTPLGTYLDIDFDMVDSKNVLSMEWSRKFQTGEITEAELNFAGSAYRNVVQEFRATLAARK
jgi:SAM-dependent methyltransferase